MESGKAIEKKARDRLNKTSIFDMFSMEQKRDECVTLLKQAGNRYLTEKNPTDGIRCLKDCNEIYREIKGEEHLICENLRLMVQHGKDVCSLEEIMSFYVAIADYHGLKGDLSRYNAQYLEMAKIYEDANQLDLALSALTKCVDDKYPDKVLEKKADILLKLKKYADASNIFQQVAENQLAKPLGSFSARKQFCMAMLCVLALGDLVLAERSLNSINNADYAFASTKEGILVTDILKALNDNNQENFEYACADYDKIIKLTPTQVDLLMDAKSMLTGKEGVDEDYDLS